MRLLITAIQYSASFNKDENLAVIEKYIREIHKNIPHDNTEYEHLVCLPEVFNFYAFGIKDPDERKEVTKQNAEIIESGKTLQWASKLAQELNINILAGSILETNIENIYKPFNTAFVVNNTGELVTKYRKINLFEIKHKDKNQVSISESSNRSRGTKLSTFNIGEIKFGLGICFDLRFPEMFVTYRQMGCHVLLLPSAFLHQTGQYHWDSLCHARAIENQSFFIALNQGIKSNCYGNTKILDPWGNTVEQLAQEDLASITALIDTDDISSIRNKMDMQRFYNFDI